MATFQIVCLGWLVFRANTIDQMLAFLFSIFTQFIPDAQTFTLGFHILLFGGALLIVEWCTRNLDDPRSAPFWNMITGSTLASAMGFALLILAPPERAAFLYFQF
jgi:hypothetical protein